MRTSAAEESGASTETPPALVDSHCHLDFDAFDDDRDAVLDRARAAGVHAVVIPGVSPTGWRPLGALLDRHRAGPLRLAGAVGIHPMVVPDLDDEALDRALGELPDAAQALGAVAVGECGLDGVVARRDRGGLDRQRRVFRAQIAVARDLGLPIMLHVFRAQEDALKILEADGPLPGGGVVHSYSGSAELVPRWLDLGLHLSFAGSVTRPNARRPRAAAAAVPADRLLVETDAPDQTPHGAPTRRNEPAYVAGILRALANARGEPPETVARQTTANARALFRMPSPEPPGG